MPSLRYYGERNGDNPWKQFLSLFCLFFCLVAAVGMGTAVGTIEGRYKPSLKAFSKPFAADWALLGRRRLISKSLQSGNIRLNFREAE
jgi:hypothetical protein